MYRYMDVESNHVERYLQNQIERSTSVWYVVRHLPNLQSIVVAKFSSRTKAEAHLRFLKQTRPTASYTIAFDCVSE